MDSANLYEHHQLQPQLLYSSLASSSSASASLGVSALHDWNPSIVLDGYEFNRYMNEILPNSPSIKSPSLQEIRFGDARSYVHPPANKKLQFENIKGSISDNFLKLSDMNCSSSYNSYSYIKNEHQDQDVLDIDLNENLSWLSSFPKQKLSSSESYSNGESFARFGVAGVASAASSFMSSCTDHNNNLYAPSSLLSSSSPSLQLAADHILSYTNGVEGSNQSFQERNSLPYFHVQQSSHSPSNSSNKTSTFRNEASRAEKLSACSTHEVVAKKPRLSSSSCPTLKVRKEKLGDRIAALHRLVSPFGKTDTASVLTEAIGYIQFLQDQIQTLSRSYSKSSRNKTRRTTRGDLRMKDDLHQKEDEPIIHQDLRSRELCLAPLAFTSYICSYNRSI